MKFQYYNDTNRIVGIHPATMLYDIKMNNTGDIYHGEVRTFTLPEGSYPIVKMWDYGGRNGLQILVIPQTEDKGDM